MLELIKKTNIDFVGKRYIFFAISGAVLLAGMVSLIMKGGPKWGLDFTGGTLIEFKFQNPPPLEQIRKTLTDKNIPSFEIQSVTGQGVFIIRTQLHAAAKEDVNSSSTTAVAAGTASNAGNQDMVISNEIQSALNEAFPNQSITLLRREYVGPTVGKHLGKQTLQAFLLTFLGIIIYVAFRFHSGVWGASGVIALIHDVAATIGFFSIIDKEITVTVVAALLTIAGYSINDTIVVFDYMREKLRLLRTEPLEVIINRSINETLSRTIITNLTVFVVVSTLYFFGGEVIHDFAVAMVFGAIVGTYSSIAVAAPIIYEWEVGRSKRK